MERGKIGWEWVFAGLSGAVRMANSGDSCHCLAEEKQQRPSRNIGVRAPARGLLSYREHLAMSAGSAGNGIDDKTVIVN